MRKSIARILSVSLGFSTLAWAAPNCERPQDALAVHVTAMQQEMMVGALVCHEVEAYNHFVLSHQAALQESDRALQHFFLSNDVRKGLDDYNAFKTERANAFSLRSLHDPQFCDEVKANFQAADNRPLQDAVALEPYPAETGALSCVMPRLPDATEARLLPSDR